MIGSIPMVAYNLYVDSVEVFGMLMSGGGQISDGGWKDNEFGGSEREKSLHSGEPKLLTVSSSNGSGRKVETRLKCEKPTARLVGSNPALTSSRVYYLTGNEQRGVKRSIFYHAYNAPQEQETYGIF